LKPGQVIGVIARECDWQSIISDKLKWMFSFSKTKAVKDAGNGGGV